MLIEDDPADARLIRELLSETRENTLQLWVDQTLNRGLQRLAREPADLVLLDLSLPDSSGLETYQRLRATLPEMAVVALSGSDDEALATRTVQEGAQDSLVKGHFDGLLLLRAIRYAIERHRSESALARERDLLQTLMNNPRPDLLQAWPKPVHPR